MNARALLRSLPAVPLAAALFLAILLAIGYASPSLSKAYALEAGACYYVDADGARISVQDAEKIVESTTVLENGAWYYVEGDVAMDHALTVADGEQGAHLILCDGSSLTIRAQKWDAGIGVTTNATLFIHGQDGTNGAVGTLSATGSFYGAGIGGGESRGCGTVRIDGGDITADARDFGAGIGGGFDIGDGDGFGGRVFIGGGKVTAIGGEGSGPDSLDVGAGIGSGGDVGFDSEGTSGSVTITGGTVHATGGGMGAGIGGGMPNNGRFGGDGGSLTVTGGEVSAIGGLDGAGIGGGVWGDGGTVRIEGGRVTATGGGYGAGIGGGGIGGAGASVYIGEATVTASGGVDGGAGIGGGVGDGDHKAPGGAGGTLTVAGGTVIAHGTDATSGIGAASGIGGAPGQEGSGEGATVVFEGGQVSASSEGGAAIGGAEGKRHTGSLLVQGATSLDCSGADIGAAVLELGPCTIANAFWKGSAVDGVYSRLSVLGGQASFDNPGYWQDGIVKDSTEVTLIPREGAGLYWIAIEGGPLAIVGNEFAMPSHATGVRAEEASIEATAFGLGSPKVGKPLPSDARIEFELDAGAYADRLVDDSFEVGNLPSGIEAGKAVRTGDAVVTVPLSGTPTKAGSEKTTLSAPRAIGFANIANGASDIPVAGTLEAGVVGKGDGASIVGELEVARTSSTSVELSPAVIESGTAQTVEYAISAGGEEDIEEWKAFPLLAGLQPDSVYQVFARSAENDDYLAGSPVRIEVRTSSAENQEAGFDRPPCDKGTALPASGDPVGHAPAFALAATAAAAALAFVAYRRRLH
ncbi:hypothetical protein [Arabiibacter massiliensis]|uniref:hypothetical protein n=1 Tax=Arabiibacter massiliensis TaxID=1870985 RepID=UPI0009B9F6BA|nr:hypothetical protein [Arabiibacter massiliensis]